MSQHGMKLGLSLIVLVLWIGILSACGGSDSSNINKEDENASPAVSSSNELGDKTEETPALSGKIVFATGRTDVAETTLTDAAKAFMELYPGTEIVIEAVKDINTIKTRMAANELPDIAQIPREVLTSDYPEHYLPIDDLGFTPDNIYFYDSGVGGDGKLYGVSSAIAYSGVVYNKNVFKEAGIENTPKSVEELWIAADKIKALGKVPFISNFKDGWPLARYLNGSFSVDITGNGNYNNSLIDADLLAVDGGNLAGLDFIRTLNEKGYLEKDLLSTNWDGSKRDLASGNMGMNYIASYLPPQVADNGANIEDIGMFPLPGGKGVSAAADWFHAISKDSKHPELAKAFYKYLFMDGVFAEKGGLILNSKLIEPSEPFILELLDGNPTIIETIGNSPELVKILNSAEIDAAKIVQEYILADNPSVVVEKYNKVWDDAKK